MLIKLSDFGGHAPIIKKRIDGNNEILKNNFLLIKLKDEKKRKIIKSILMEIEKLLDELL